MYVSSLQEGLLCFDENGKFLQSYKVSSDVNSSDSYKINCVLDVEGEVWLGAGNNLLGRLNRQTGTVENYMAPSLNFGAVRSLLKYTENELLVGTDNGLYLSTASRKLPPCR